MDHYEDLQLRRTYGQLRFFLCKIIITETIKKVDSQGPYGKFFYYGH